VVATGEPSIAEVPHPNDQRAHCEQMFALRTHHVRFVVESQVVKRLGEIRKQILLASSPPLTLRERSRTEPSPRELFRVNEIEIRNRSPHRP
jgi:hypothetical protein